MSQNPEQTPPALPELFAQYLQRQVSARDAGLSPAEAPGEVVPFEAVSTQPIDPRLAWNEATAVLGCFPPGTKKAALQPPADWPSLVAAHEPMLALAFCIGNFPQLLRNLQSLLHAKDLGTLRPAAGRAGALPTVVDWAQQTLEKGQFPQSLLAVGTLRLAKQYDLAAEALQKHQAAVPAEWRAAWANEEAALAWHRGEAEKADQLWQAQPDSIPVLFNRGMAALFLGRPSDARAALAQAIEHLPDDSAWHHLGRLYMALAEMRASS